VGKKGLDESFSLQNVCCKNCFTNSCTNSIFENKHMAHVFRSEYLKMGYVSRYNIQDSSRHVVIGTQQFIPKEFASQINLAVSNAWGILRCIVDLCMKQPEGKYLILKVTFFLHRQIIYCSENIQVFCCTEGIFVGADERRSSYKSEKARFLSQACCWRKHVVLHVQMTLRAAQYTCDL